MRLFSTSIILTLLLLGCKESDKLTFDNVSLAVHNCENCPVVIIDIPKALENNKISETINNVLKEEIIMQLTYDDEVEVLEIEDAIASFKKEYLNIQKLHPEEQTVWEAKFNGALSYEDSKMITITLETYIFTGGAHGYTATHFLNFNKKKGLEIADWELFNDRKDFQRFAENKFRKQEKIPNGAPINSTGYMFERDAFYLPENIGFTEGGIKLLYNQYEVASYADGPIELVLPYKEVRKYLAKELKS